jgi:UDP-glucuronate decarboxylase
MRCDDGRVVSNVICQALSGKDITVYGEGTQTRCFGYVDDTIEGLLRLMDSDNTVGLPVNLGDPREMTVRELVVLVISLTATSPSIVEQPLPQDDPKRRKPDIGRAMELLGWRPTVALEDGLAATIAWFREELQAEQPEAEPALAAE